MIDKSIGAILNRRVNVLENMYSIFAATMLNTDVVIVYSKCDMLGAGEAIGGESVSERIRTIMCSRE